MTMFCGKNILLGITGGIAAYKSAELVRSLIKGGATVRVMMTESAKEFITPLTLQTLSNHMVYDDLFVLRTQESIEHIELARWADLILIAPATANFIAKLSQGLADDFLSTVCLASDRPIVVAPAMNQGMWENSVTKGNIQALRERNISIFGPEKGFQACGEEGWGRMLSVESILKKLPEFFLTGSLSGKRVLITAGPTIEPIDPVRYLSNRSSGKMGFAVAQAAVEAGALVTLISGPVSLSAISKIKRIDVETAQEMFDAVMTCVEEADIFISTAAVADYRCQERKEQKIKKEKETFSLQMVRNPDILSAVSSLKDERPYVVGFAAETDHLVEHAKKKLQDKNLDMIVANRVGLPEQGFESDHNALTILFAHERIEMPCDRKAILAHHLIELIAKQQN